MRSAPVAQLDRANDFESLGRGFEPLRARQQRALTILTTGALQRQPGAAGLSWPWLCLTVLVAAALVVLRKPDVLNNPQFYAEDGAVWYADAYNLGWLRALTIPDGGYLNSLQRLVAAISLLVPLRYAPLVRSSLKHS